MDWSCRFRLGAMRASRPSAPHARAVRRCECSGAARRRVPRESGRCDESGAHCAGGVAPAFNAASALPQRVEIGAQARVVVQVGAGARDQQDVDRRAAVARVWRKLSRAMRLMRLRRDRAFGHAARNREAEACAVSRRWLGDLGVEVRGADAPAGVAQAGRNPAGWSRRAARGKRGAGAIADSGVWRIRPARRLRPLARRALRTVRPPRGLHARTETVVARALEVARLVGALGGHERNAMIREKGRGW